ncbi:hypothetical protein ACU639_03860 [Streptomyces cynarae]|uniref:hypothetical protein n=1 Tax=Streptomyces cynarae TaxID=2981134 RepID=UPI00406C2793
MSASVEYNAPSPACDCLAHRFGKAADGLERVRQEEGRTVDPTAAIVDVRSS